MDLGSVFLLLAIIIVVLLIITQPFSRNHEETVTDTGYFVPLEHSKEEYQGILRNIGELNGDFEQGKITVEDFAAQKSMLEEQALAALEDQKQTRRTDSKAKQNDDREIEDMIHTRRQIRQEQTAGFCPKCGKPVQKSDVFCPSCGERTQLYL